MTKEQFLKKYFNQGVLICDDAIREWIAYTKKSKTIIEDTGILTEVKKRLDVDCHKDKFIRAIGFDYVFVLHEKNIKGPFIIGFTYSLASFVEDFISFCEYEDEINTKIEKERLEGLRISIAEEIGRIGEKYTEIAHSDIKTTKDAENLGFINGFTNTKISLWWNVEGVRLVFARGYGVFELK